LTSSSRTLQFERLKLWICPSEEVFHPLGRKNPDETLEAGRPLWIVPKMFGNKNTGMLKEGFNGKIYFFLNFFFINQ
jgi:hypothetical protein